METATYSRGYYTAEKWDYTLRKKVQQFKERSRVPENGSVEHMDIYDAAYREIHEVFIKQHRLGTAVECGTDSTRRLIFKEGTNAVIKRAVLDAAADAQATLEKRCKTARCEQLDLNISLDYALSRKINKLISLASLAPSACLLEEHAGRLAAEIRLLQDELDDAKTKLEQLQTACTISESVHIDRITYPDIPLPRQITSELGDGVPMCSGIYFAWEGSTCAYVGQSVNLNSRCKLRSHHALTKGDYLSWLEFPIDELNFAESFYIGLCKPHRNFGGRKYR